MDTAIRAFMQRYPAPVGYREVSVRSVLPTPTSGGPLTQARLAAALSYDAKSGVFRWRVGSARAKAGMVAGSLRSDGYRVIRLDNQSYAAHRLAWLYMTGEMPSLMVDHINGDPCDNRWANLRLATNVQNQANTGLRSTNTSGFKGVSCSKRERRWRADIRMGGRKVSLGLFSTPEEAHRSYASAANDNHGSFARVA